MCIRDSECVADLFLYRHNYTRFGLNISVLVQIETWICRALLLRTLVVLNDIFVMNPCTLGQQACALSRFIVQQMDLI